MKKLAIKIVTAVFVLGLSSQYAVAACTKASIKGNFAGEAFFPETDDYYASNSVVMLYFNGSGAFSIKKIVEGANGGTFTGFGGGTYSIQPNCTGLVQMNIKQNGKIVGRGKMDIVVGGTKALPEIYGVYTNKDDKSTGNVRMIKSNL